MTTVSERGQGDVIVPRRVVVSGTEDMDVEIFCKHLNLRHKASMGGIELDPETLSEYVEGMYRVFHDHLHRWLFPGLGHDHESPGEP